MLRRWVVTLLAGVLLPGVAAAVEINFTEDEVNVGQSAAAATAIDGDEWLTFGIDMNGLSLLVYGPPNPDPFPPPTDMNGVFEAGDDSFEIVFVDPITDLEVDWFSPSLADSRFLAFGPGGEVVETKVNPGGTAFETEVFTGVIARLVIESDPQTLCVANLRFNEPLAVPGLSRSAAVAVGIVLALGLAALPAWRRRQRATSTST